MFIVYLLLAVVPFEDRCAVGPVPPHAASIGHRKMTSPVVGEREGARHK